MYTLLLKFIAIVYLIKNTLQTTCNEGQGYNPYSDTCFSCIKQCYLCQVGYNPPPINNNGLQLFSDSYQKCIQCNDGYHLSEDGKSCLIECDNYVDPENNQCQSCKIQGCKICSSQNVCQSCLKGFDLVGDQCIATCHSQNKYLNDNVCVSQCPLKQYPNDQSSICQSISACPTQKQISNQCHSYSITIHELSIMNIEKITDNKKQDILVSYDNFGFIKFWYYNTAIEYISQVSGYNTIRNSSLVCKLSQKQYYFCIYPQFVLALDLKSSKVEEIQILNQSKTGELKFIDFVTSNNIDYLCLQSEKKVILFEINKLFEGFSQEQLNQSIKLDAIQSKFISVVQFSLDLLVYNSIEKWTDTDGKQYQGVLYQGTQKVCSLKQAYTDIRRAHSNVYIINGQDTFCIVLVNKLQTSCQEYAVQNVNKALYKMDFISSNTKIIMVIQRIHYYYNSFTYKLFEIKQDDKMNVILNENSQFQFNVTFKNFRIQNDRYLIYADSQVGTTIYKLDLTNQNLYTYYMKLNFYNIYIVDEQIILRREENNLVHINLNENGQYTIEKYTICKTQMPVDTTTGFTGANMIDEVGKKYTLHGFMSNYVLKDMKNAQTIALIQVNTMHSPIFNQQKTKIFFPHKGGILIIDLLKNQEDENELITQLLLPKTYQNGIYFSDSLDNIYIYSCDDETFKFITQVSKDGQIIKEFNIRFDLLISSQFRFFSDSKKIVCLVSEKSAILVILDFINQTKSEINIFSIPNEPIEPIFYVIQISDSELIALTANFAFKYDISGNQIKKISNTNKNDEKTKYLFFKSKNIIVLFQTDKIYFKDTDLNDLAQTFQTYGSLTTQIIFNQYIFAAYDSNKLQIIDYTKNAEVIQITSSVVTQITSLKDGIHFGLYSGQETFFYSIDTAMNIKRTYNLNLQNTACQQNIFLAMSQNYQTPELIYSSQDTTGICTIIGNYGYTNSQIQLKIPGQKYLNYLSATTSNYSILQSIIDNENQIIFLVLLDQSNKVFLGKSPILETLQIQIMNEINEPSLVNLIGFKATPEYQLIYYRNGFVIYRQNQNKIIVNNIPTSIAQVNLELSEDILAISNLKCEWFIYKFSTGELLYRMPINTKYDSNWRCTCSFDKKRSLILLKQTNSIASYNYEQKQIYYYYSEKDLTTQILIGLDYIEDLDVIVLLANPNLAGFYSAPLIQNLITYQILYNTITYTKTIYDSYNKRIIFCNSDYLQCKVFTKDYTLLKSISFKQSFDINQLIFIQNPINAIIVPSSTLQIQVMYLGDDYTTPETQVKLIDLKLFSQELASYDKKTDYKIIDDFQKDTLIISFNDSIYFVKISTNQVIQYINFSDNLSSNQANGQVLNLNLDKQRNILTCITKENIMLYDYSSITFYDQQNFNFVPSNQNLIEVLDNNQNNDKIIITREFQYNYLSFYRASFEFSEINSFIQVNVVSDSDLQFQRKGTINSDQYVASLNDRIKYNSRVIKISFELILLQHHKLRYTLYQINQKDVKKIKNFFYKSNDYQFYQLVEEDTFVPILILQIISSSKIFIQKLDTQSEIKNISSVEFSNLIDSCEIRKQVVYCYSSSGNYFLQINIENIEGFKVTQTNQIDPLLDHKGIQFCTKLTKQIYNMPLIFYFENIVFSYNVNDNSITKRTMPSKIQNLYLGYQYLLIQIQSQFDILLIPLNEKGEILSTNYIIKLPVQQNRDLSSFNVPKYDNYKFDQTHFSEQISQFLVLKTYGQVNIYSLLDFSIYLTIRDSQILSVQSIQILSDSAFLLMSKNSVDVYQFSKNQYQKLQSFELKNPMIGYANIYPLQLQDQYRLDIIVSTHNDISLIQYSIKLNTNNINSGRQSIKDSNLICIKTFSKYNQDLSLRGIDQEMVNIDEQFMQKGYSDLQVLEVYFKPETNIFFRQEMLKTLQNKDYILRVFSDSNSSVVYLQSEQQMQNVEQSNNLFISSIQNIEILKMLITLPKTQLSQNLIIEIKDMKKFKMNDSQIVLDQKVTLNFENLDYISISNTNFQIQQLITLNETQIKVKNQAIIQIKNVKTVEINNLTFNSQTITGIEQIKNLLQFENVDSLTLSNIQIMDSNLELDYIFCFKQIQKLILNDIQIEKIQLNGTILSGLNIGEIQLSKINIQHSQFSKEEQIIKLNGNKIIGIHNMTVYNCSIPSLLLIQEYSADSNIQITSSVTINQMNLTNNNFVNDTLASISIQTLNIALQDVTLNENYFALDGIAIKTNSASLILSSFTSNKAENSLVTIGIYRTLDKNQENEIDIQIQSSNFSDNTLKKGQVLNIRDNENLYINKCTIYANTLQNSFQGTISIMNFPSVLINDSTFEKNDVQKGCGGGFYFYQSNVILTKTQIIQNSAVIGGGIRYQGLLSSLSFKKSQTRLLLNYEDSVIQNNKALMFGQDIASYPKEFKFMKDYTNLLQNLISGQALPEPIVFQLIDYEGQNVIYPQQLPNDVVLHLTIADEFLGYNVIIQIQNEQDIHIQGGFEIKNNKFQFQPIITSIPNSSFELNIQLSKQVSILNESTQKFESGIIQQKLNLKFLSCQTGEIPKDIFNLVQCYSCPSGTYSFYNENNNTQNTQILPTCQHCPLGADFCEKDAIILKDGYWRKTPTSEDVLLCVNNENNCKQSSNRNKYVISSSMSQDDFIKSTCAVGHIGPLCESCDINQIIWDESYSVSSNFTCVSCKSIALNYFVTFLVLLLTLSYLTFSFRKIKRFTTSKCILMYLKKMNMICIGKSSLSDQNAVATKMLMNYVQIISVIFQFTNFYDDFYSVFNIFGDPVAKQWQIIFLKFKLFNKIPIRMLLPQEYQVLYYKKMSLDCILVGIDYGNMLTKRAILRLLIPIFFVIIFVSGVFIFKGDNIKMLKCDAKASIIFLWLFFSPSLINYFVQQLSCKQIGGDSYVFSDMQFTCFSEEHLQTIFFVLAPCLTLLYLIIPLYFYFFLQRQRNHLYTIKNIKIYGLMFYEYRKDMYFWELVKTSQKSLIYLCTFFANLGTKAFISLSILLLYTCLTRQNRPYSNFFASILQFMSIVLCLVINNSENDIWHAIIVFFIVFVNAIFILELLIKIIVREIPYDTTQRNIFHNILLFFRNRMPRCLSKSIIIQSSHQFLIFRRWSLIQRQFKNYVNIKRDQRNLHVSSDLLENLKNNLILNLQQQSLSTFNIGKSSVNNLLSNINKLSSIQEKQKEQSENNNTVVMTDRHNTFHNIIDTEEIHLHVDKPTISIPYLSYPHHQSKNNDMAFSSRIHMTESEAIVETDSYKGSSESSSQKK